MIDKIYEKDNFENQQIFHDIEQAKKYSNYSIELNQTFGDKSYEKFYKSLIEHKKARGLNFMSMFQKPKNSTELKVYEEPFDIKEFKAALKTMKIKNDKLIYRIKNPYKTRHKFLSQQKEEKKEEIKSVKNTNNKKNKNKKINKININNKIKNKLKNENEKVYLPEVPDVGRYNPIYNVLDKHTYKVAFSQQNFEEFNKSGIKYNSRNIFNDHRKIDYNYNDKPLTLEMKTKFIKSKIKPIYMDINNMSKTYNKKDGIQNINEIKRKMSNHFNTSSSLYNSLNLQASTNSNLNQNISTNIETNKSTLQTNKTPYSPILIRTNGDNHSRCPKHINNLNINNYLYNTNTSISFDDSIINNNSFNMSNSGFNTTSKNNHCLKFETYTKRKPMIKRFNYINEDFTNAEAFNSMYSPKNKNICVEFNKLSTSKEKQKSFFEVEANKNKNPPLGTYYPKYLHAFKKIIDVYIDKKCPPLNNKRRLKEIMLKYDVPSNYLLFDALNKK